jgi:hypothetical protein
MLLSGEKGAGADLGQKEQILYNSQRKGFQQLPHKQTAKFQP